jgi:hypothetical protein
MMSTYTVSGRVVDPDGVPVSNATVRLHEIVSLTGTPPQRGASATTDASGRFSIVWTDSSALGQAHDVFVVAEKGRDRVESALIGDLDSMATVDLTLGVSTHRGRTEWERIEARLAPLLCDTAAQDIPADRLGWLGRRADVSSIHLGDYIQAHRIAAGRTIKPQSCYAFLRIGLPADLPELLKVGPDAWTAALRDAWARRILPVPDDTEAELARECDAMRELVIEAAAHGRVFTAAGLDDVQQHEFMRLWVAHTGPLPAFWDAVRRSHALGPERAADFQFAIQASLVVGNHAPTLAALAAERATGAFTTVADLAAWDVADWERLLSRHDVEPPDHARTREAHARSLARVIEDSYPTAFFRHALARDERGGVAPAHTAHVAAFLSNHPEFDLTTTTIARFLAATPDAWRSVPLEDQLLARANLERVQRVHRMTPRIGRYDTAKALLDKGIGAAADVTAFTRSEFVSAFAKWLPTQHHEPLALAGAIWDLGALIRSGVISVASQLGMAGSGADFLPLGGIADVGLAQAGEGLDSLAAILGQLDYCACSHCRSVLSPAAYLADLLGFLDDRPALTQVDALGVLRTRRPDIEHILLDCTNTHTELPAIDLVNELLERMLGGGLGPSSYQTTATADELRMHPQHVDAEVYVDSPLTNRVHPWVLPFSLPVLESRVYLRQLGVPRAELLDLLAGDPLEIAAEVLGMSKAEATIVVGDAPNDLHEFWGSFQAPNNWVAALATDIGELLQRGGYTLEELRERLSLTFIDPHHYTDGGIEIRWSETCALADAEIVNLDAGALDRLHRFTRLARRSGVPVRMLNVLVDDVGGGMLDADFLRTLADIHALHERFGRPWDELATWWSARVDAREYGDAMPSLYHRRFLGPSAPAAFHVTGPRGDAIVGAEVIGPAELPTLLAAAQCTTADYDRMRTAGLVTAELSFSNVTRVFAVASLCRALGLPVDEFVALRVLLDVDPFESPATTRRLVEQLDGIRSSGFSIRELFWLLRHDGAALLTLADIARTLDELAHGIVKIDAEVELLTDPDGQATRANLTGVVSDLDVAMAIIDGTKSLPAADQVQFIEAEFASFVDPAIAVAALVNGPDVIVGVELRRAWVLRMFVGHRRRRALLVDLAASAFALPAAAVEVLLFEVLRVPGGSTMLGQLYLEGVDSPDAAHGWLRLGKAAVLAKRLPMSAEDLRFFPGHLDGAWLDLDALPLNVGDAVAGFSTWDRLRTALSLRALVLPQLAAAGTPQAALQILAERTGCPAPELSFIAQQLGLATVADLTDERSLQRLRDIAVVGQRAGVTLDVLWSWVHAPPTLERSAEIHAAARSKLDETRWRDVAIPLSDELRVAKRDALVAASLSTPVQLYEHLLVDVGVAPCMLTSRIAAAIGSVQTFVNRVLLRLEADDVTFTADAVRRWEPMSTYRVWEANRKVFLYPENWLEPELRPDKTTLFEALETKLLQDTLEPDAIQRALAGYLDSLELVANLEVAAIYSDFGELWILGRTQNTPRQWFVRRRNKSKQWDPWEPLPGQIDSDHVLMIARDGRVQLFWLTVFEARAPGFVPADNFDGDNAHRFAISWMQRGEEGWSRSEVSARSAEVLKPWGFEARLYLLRAFVLDDDIQLIVYRKGLKSSVKPVAEFCYNMRARHVAYVGIDFDPEVFADVLSPQGALERPSWIGLQPSYRFEGQRFVKVRLNEDPDGDDNILDIGLADVPPPASSTSFVQGSASAVLFRRSTRSGYRSLLHAGDYWGLDPTKKWLPVVYDDREHKYLLEPLPIAADASAEGDDASPQLMDTLDVAPYGGCMEVVLPKQFKAGPSQGKVQKQQEGLALALHTMGANVDSGQGDPHSGVLSLSLQALHHPYASRLVEQLLTLGVDGVYRPETNDLLFRQRLDHDPFKPVGLDLNEEILRGIAPIERFDFDFGSTFGVYNWEVFFHLPMLIAGKLSADQRFAEAQQWFHTIFDPIEVVDLPGETAASKFWRIRPFVEQAAALSKNQFLIMLGIGATKAEKEAAIERFEQQVVAWQQHPFDPHAIARIRPGVYQRNLLMRYLDNLIEWADHLFRRDSAESLHEATLLYMLVTALLGPRPQQVPGPEGTAKSYHQLVIGENGLNDLNNAAQQIENWLVPAAKPAKVLGCGGDVQAPNVTPHLEVLRFWYFCHPPNPELLKYWDIVDDRLWKIRHCRNIEGVERRLPLFQPPIDPGLLVRATAAGVDLGAVLDGFDTGLPPYRFRFVHARASNFCASLRNLGAALLSAIEKRDAEALSRLRAEQEVTTLAAVRDVRVRQIDEARTWLESLRLARVAVEQRHTYFSTLVDEGLSAGELTAQTMSLQAGILRAVVQGGMATAGLFHLIPDVTISVGTDASVKTTTGGTYFGSGLRAAAEYVGVIPTALDAAGAWIASNAAYDRRAADWEFSRDQAQAELTRIDRDIAATEIRVAISERELANHELQLEQSTETDRFLRDKFSNRELYDWMLGQLSALYFQTYQLAVDLAKRAERAYRHELAIRDGAPIIGYGHWDSLRKGLLAGERLGLELDRLDVAYMDRDVREFELRKNISLAQLAPGCLLALQETGTCEFELPEALFDLDHPGHYLRRIRGVRLTIPAVAGPLVSLGARLELQSHRTRIDPSVAGGDDRYRHGYGGGQVVATSTALSDGGVFNLDFRDERYLPFEYAGAVSRWKLTLPGKLRLFDYRSISDTILHLDYTARDGGTSLRDATETGLVEQLDGLTAELELGQLFIVQDAFPNEWARFLAPGPNAVEQTLELPIGLTSFPYFAQRQGFTIKRLDLAMLATDVADGTALTLTLTGPTTQAPVQLTKPDADAAILTGNSGVLAPPQPPGAWTIRRAKALQPGDLDNPDGWLDPAKVRGLVLAVRYTLGA